MPKPSPIHDPVSDFCSGCAWRPYPQCAYCGRDTWLYSDDEHHAVTICRACFKRLHNVVREHGMVVWRVYGDVGHLGRCDRRRMRHV